MNVLLVFVKYPEPGKVKTRLTPLLTSQQAADLYQAMMLDSLEAYQSLDIVVRPQIEPPSRREDFVKLFPWPLDLDDQSPGDLGARMAAAFKAAFDAGAEKAVVIGTDHPSLPLNRIQKAFGALGDPKKIVAGPADDGGYYLLGMSRPHQALFEGIPWSGPEVLATTRKKAQNKGLNLMELDAWYDVDVAADLDRLRKDLKNKDIACSRTRQALSGMD